MDIVQREGSAPEEHQNMYGLQAEVVHELLSEYSDKAGVELISCVGNGEIWFEIVLNPKDGWDSRKERNLRPKEVFDRHENVTPDREEVRKLLVDYLDNIFSSGALWEIRYAQNVDHLFG